MNKLQSNIGMYYFVSNSTYACDVAERIFIQYLENKGALEVERVEANTNIVDIFNRANTPSFFSEYKLMIMRRPEGISANDIQRISKLALDESFISSGSIILIIDNKINYKFNSKSVKTIEVKQLKEDEIIDELVHYANINENPINRSIAQYLVQISNKEVDYAINELNKILLYNIGTNANCAELNSIVRVNQERSIFLIMDCIIAKQYAKSIEELSYLVSSSGGLGGVMYNFAKQFRMMLLMSLSNKSLEEYIKILAIADWQARKIDNNAKAFTKKQLLEISEKLLQYEYEFKSGNCTELSAINNVVSYIINRRV